MAAKIQKSPDLGKIWFPSRLCSCELISIIVFGIGSINDHSDHIISCYYCFTFFLKVLLEAVMVVIVWELDLHLPMQSMPDVVSANLDQGEVYNIM